MYTSNTEMGIATAIKLAATGHRGFATSFVETAVRLTPNQPGRHMEWVREFRCHKELDLALVVCNEAFLVDGDVPVIRLNRGYLFYEMGNYTAADEDLNIAAKSRPDSEV
jgi:hypothetical protein